MIERGKIQPLELIWMQCPIEGLVAVEYVRHWGRKVKVRHWRIRAVTASGQLRMDSYTEMVAPSNLFATRDAALDGTKGAGE